MSWFDHWNLNIGHNCSQAKKLSGLTVSELKRLCYERGLPRVVRCVSFIAQPYDGIAGNKGRVDQSARGV